MYPTYVAKTELINHKASMPDHFIYLNGMMLKTNDSAVNNDLDSLNDMLTAEVDGLQIVQISPAYTGV